MIEIDFGRIFSHWASCSRQSLEIIKSRFSFDRPYQLHERGEIEAPEYFASLRKSLGLDLTDEEFVEGWNSVYVGEVPGIAALLADASGKWPIYAFTNSNSTHQREWSKRFKDVLSHFRKVFVSSEIGKRKPEREAFEIVSREIGVTPERILLFDDTLENITGARRMGMQAVHVASTRDIEACLRGSTPMVLTCGGMGAGAE